MYTNSYIYKSGSSTHLSATGFAPLSCKLAQVEALVWTRIKLTLHGVFQSRTADKVSKQMPRNLWLQMQRFLLDVGCTFFAALCALLCSAVLPKIYG